MRKPAKIMLVIVSIFVLTTILGACGKKQEVVSQDGKFSITVSEDWKTSTETNYIIYGEKGNSTLEIYESYLPESVTAADPELSKIENIANWVVKLVPGGKVTKAIIYQGEIDGKEAVVYTERKKGIEDGKTALFGEIEASDGILYKIFLSAENDKEYNEKEFLEIIKSFKIKE